MSSLVRLPRSVAYDVVVRGGEWLAAVESEQSAVAYARTSGLRYFAWQAGLCDELAATVWRCRPGRRIQGGPPGARAVHPEITWFPWAFSHDIHPLDCDGTRVGLRDFAVELAAEDLRRGARGQRLGTAARVARLQAACSFYDHMAETTGTGCEPCRDLSPRWKRRVGLAASRRPEFPQTALDDTEIGLLIQAAGQIDGMDPQRRRRAQALVALIADAQLRSGTVRELSVEDYDRREAGADLTIRPKGRGVRARQVAISDATAGLIDAYLQTRPRWDLAPLPDGTPAPLFRNTLNGRPYAVTRIRRMSLPAITNTVAAAGREAGITRRVTPRLLRGSMITRTRTRHGLDVAQMVAGHADASTTQLYDAWASTRHLPARLDIDGFMRRSIEGQADLGLQEQAAGLVLDPEGDGHRTLHSSEFGLDELD